MRLVLLHKFITACVSLAMIVTVTFFLMKIIPGDPFISDKAIPEEMQANLKRHYQLDEPWTKQFIRHAYQALRLDFGHSYRYPRESTNGIIRTSFKISALLGLQALLLSVLFGLIVGTCSALYENRWQDTTLTILTILGISVPSFILATLLQYYIALKWEFLPLARWGTWTHTILPTIATAALPAAFLSRLVRSNLIDVFTQNYIQTAITKGLTKKMIVFKHAMPQALLPILPYLAPLTANILIGSFVVEQIFAIPGMGQWIVLAVSHRDYTLISAITLLYSFLLLGFNFIMDLLYFWLDPRQRSAYNAT